MASAAVLPSSTSRPSTPPATDLKPATNSNDQENSVVSLTASSSFDGVPHTVYDDVDPALYLGPRGTQRTLQNRQGLKLKSYWWPADRPKCVLAFVHGHGAHMHFELLKKTAPGQPLAYEGSWVEAFNAAGISVAGVDNQGCGRSEGLRGLRFYVESFEDYVVDVLQLVDATKTAGDGFSAALPTFISGISLGGCIAFTAAQRRPELFAGVVLLAPMLSLERVSRKGLNPYLLPLSAVLSKFLPAALLVATDRNTMYPEIQVMWDADPLTLVGNTRVRNANEYLRATVAAMAAVDEVAFPFLVFHSENDTMCDPAGSKTLYLKAKSKDKTLRLVNGMWHVLVKEEGNERVRTEMISWMVSRA